MDRRIDPTRRPDGSPDNNDRLEIGPTALAFAEWAAAGLAPPDLAAMRRYRLDRLVAQVQARDLAGLLLFDPLNIRYATDSTNMQIWNMGPLKKRAFVGRSRAASATSSLRRCGAASGGHGRMACGISRPVWHGTGAGWRAERPRAASG